MPIPPRPMSQKGTREGRASVRRNIWWSVAGAYPTTCYTMYGDSDHSGEWKIHSGTTAHHRPSDTWMASSK
ncbi:hypothetical protein VTJ04DRAFT_9365 [Mycothermus thermophilus]|uniref:uncharacterized protein n=1 Tax=Humicola insolens TaxID=85995 RepID=UPI0037426B76